MIENKISRILVPLDGSKNAQRGLEMAISIARQTGAIITGAYAIYAQSYSEFRTSGQFSKTLNDEITKIMNQAKLLCAQNGIVFKQKILRGDVGFNIIKLAHSKKEKFDLIVIGSRGRGSLKEVFFGSVSNYVIHASKIPILIVK